MKKKKKQNKILIPPICHECCVNLGAKSDGGCVTMSMQTCTVCNEEKHCAAVTDYHWPNKEFIYIFD